MVSQDSVLSLHFGASLSLSSPTSPAPLSSRRLQADSVAGNPEAPRDVIVISYSGTERRRAPQEVAALAPSGWSSGVRSFPGGCTRG